MKGKLSRVSTAVQGDWTDSRLQCGQSILFSCSPLFLPRHKNLTFFRRLTLISHQEGGSIGRVLLQQLQQGAEYSEWPVLPPTALLLVVVVVMLVMEVMVLVAVE